VGKVLKSGKGLGAKGVIYETHLVEGYGEKSRIQIVVRGGVKTGGTPGSARARISGIAGSLKRIQGNRNNRVHGRSPLLG